MATIAALEQTLNILDLVPSESRDLIKCMCTLFLLYLRMGYLTEDEVNPPPGADALRENVPHWRDNGWDGRVIAALPWLPSVTRSGEMEKHITPGASGCTYHDWDYVRQNRDLAGHLVNEEDTLPAYALALTYGMDMGDHWIWDAKEGLIRTWNYDGTTDKFEESPSEIVNDKFHSLILEITELNLVPWARELFPPPNLVLLEQSRKIGLPYYSRDANTFVFARNAYLRAGWGSAEFRLSELLMIKAQWDERILAAGDLDHDDLDWNQNEIAAEMAGEDAYK